MGRLKRNIIYSGILTASSYVFPLLVFPYVSRVLGPGNIGLCGFIDGLVNYFILLSAMGVGIAGVREIAMHRNDRDKMNRVFSSMMFLSGVTTLIAVIAMIVATVYVPELRENKVMMAVGAVKLVSNYFLIEWFYKGLEDFRYITVRSIIVKSLYVVAVFLFVREADDYVTYFLLTVLVVTVNALVNTVHARRFISFTLKGLTLRACFKPFMIFGLYMILTSMYTTFNVVYLGFVCGDVEAGYYTTATKLCAIIMALFTAFSTVMMPRLSSLLADGKIGEFRSLLAKSRDLLMSLAMPVIISVIIFAPEVVFLLSGPGFEGAVLPMCITMPMVFVIGYEQILVIQTLMPLGKDTVVMRNSAVGAVVSIALNVLLVGHLQAVGSALSWVACEILIMVLSQIAVTRAIGVGMRPGELLRTLVLYLPMAGMLWGVSVTVEGPYWKLIAGGAVTVIYFLVMQVVIFRDSLCGQAIRRLIYKK